MLLCPLCSSDGVKKIKAYTSPGYDIYHCISCDGVFADPMKSHGKDWYEKSEWECYDFNASLSIRDLRWYQEKVFLQDKPNNGKGLLLNIGCGRSDFLKRVEETGYKVIAIDFNKESIEFTKNRLGIKDAYAVDVFDFAKNYNGEQFDVIVFFEVLEHLDEPVGFIMALKNILKPDGYVVMSVPNRERLSPQKEIWDYPPHHLTRWSAKSLEKFLESNGYIVEKLLVSPITADSLVSVLKARFETKYIEDKIKKADARKADKKILISYVFKTLFKLRMAFYRILEIAGSVFIKTRGPGIYALARLKSDLDIPAIGDYIVKRPDR